MTQHERITRPARSRTASPAGVARPDPGKLLENLPVGVFALDGQGRFTYLNGAAEEFLGSTCRDLLGRQAWSVVPFLGRSRFRERFAEVMSGRETALLEAVHPASGASLDLRVSRAPGGAAVTIHDVTRRERRERALRISSARFTGILSTAAEAVICADSEQRIAFFNRAAEEMFGYGTEEVIGRPLSILMPERFRSAHQGHVARFAASEERARGMSGQNGITCLRKDGSEFPAEATISSLEVYGTRIFSAVLRDVSVRQRHERFLELMTRAGETLSSTLRRREVVSHAARLSTEFLADGCWIDLVDEGGRPERVESVHVEAGLAAAMEGLKRFAPERGGPDPSGSAWSTSKTVLVTDCSDDVLRSWTTDGTHLALLRELAPRACLAIPLLAGRRCLGVVALLSVDRGFDESDLRLAQEFARRVALALENASLHEAQARAIEARDEVLRVVSHDLRNPLHTIVLATELLRNRVATASEDVARRQIDVLRRSSERMLRLVEDLLETMTVDAGGLQLAPVELSPATMIEEAVELNLPLAQKKGISITSDAPRDLPPVLADRFRMLQVYSNLLTNAVRFTPRGGSVVVGAAREAEEIRFWVEDSGPGIPEEQRALIFRPFWQGSRRSGGAGLGLGIARGIVEKHGGKIRVEDGEAGGARFVFTLPLGRASPPPPEEGDNSPGVREG
jgi:PAS domain S-box-containing protein